MGINGGVSASVCPTHYTTSCGDWGLGARWGPSSEVQWSQHIALTKEPRLAARTNLPHQSRGTQSPLAPMGDVGLGTLPKVQPGRGRVYEPSAQ